MGLKKIFDVFCKLAASENVNENKKHFKTFSLPPWYAFALQIPDPESPSDSYPPFEHHMIFFEIDIAFSAAVPKLIACDVPYIGNVYEIIMDPSL